MKLNYHARPRIASRIMAVVFTMVAILVVSFCAAVMAVIYMHADQNGLVPRAWSLSNQVLQPMITILPQQRSESDDSKHKAPRYQI